MHRAPGIWRPQNTQRTDVGGPAEENIRSIQVRDCRARASAVDRREAPGRVHARHSEFGTARALLAKMPAAHRYARQDSNLRTRLRRPALYPLSYGRLMIADYMPGVPPLEELPVLIRPTGLVTREEVGRERGETSCFDRRTRVGDKGYQEADIVQAEKAQTEDLARAK